MGVVGQKLGTTSKGNEQKKRREDKKETLNPESKRVGLGMVKK